MRAHFRDRPSQRQAETGDAFYLLFRGCIGDADRHFARMSASAQAITSSPPAWLPAPSRFPKRGSPRLPANRPAAWW